MKVHTKHIIDFDDIELPAHKIINRLQNYGFEAYIVGGGVRDLLLKKKPKDFDIATDATPNQIKKLFRNSRIVGRRFKLAHIYFRGGKIIEVSTFRQESNDELDENGEPTNKDNFYGTIETDSLRRDLTINGLYYDPATNSIHDYVNGMHDLEKRIIKVIGDPNVRYKEDPVRIIRTMRHQARTGFLLDEKAKKAIIKHSALLKDCPQMRIYEEFKKDFCSGYFQEIFNLMEEFKLLELFMPELKKNITQRSINIQDFMFCIKGLDRAALENKLKSTTSGLAILYLFSKKDFEISEDFLKIFPKQTHISSLIENLLKPLSITKKEKIKVSSLLKALWSLENAYKKKKVFRISDEERKYDLKLLLNFLNINNSKAHLNKLLKFK